MSNPLLKIALIVAFSMLCLTARAVTLDWDTVTWTNGTLSNSYDVDGSTAGTDISVSVTGNTAQLGMEGTGEQTPAITQNFAGALSPVQNTLALFLDLNDQNQAVTITVNFSALYTQGVENVSFSLFDIDFANENGNGANFQDEIRSIFATSIDGVTAIAPIITTSANNTLTGSGLNQVVDGIATTADLGPTSGASNITISFGAAAIQSFTFTYGGSNNTQNDPTAQHIGLHDIGFTPVPEINPAIAAGGFCLVAAVVAYRQNRVKLRAGST